MNPATTSERMVAQPPGTGNEMMSPKRKFVPVTGRDSKALDEETEMARQKLMKQRADEKARRQEEINKKTAQLKRMQKHAKGGDSKALNEKTQARRRKMMEDRKRQKEAQQAEMKKRNAEMRARLWAAKQKGGDSKGLSKEVLEARRKKAEQSKFVKSHLCGLKTKLSTPSMPFIIHLYSSKNKAEPA